MAIELYVLLVVAFATFVLAATPWVLARGALAWSDAIAAQHRARAHGIEADMQNETIETARAAAERVMTGRPPPTPEQIREAILAQRAAGNGQPEDYHEFTTSGEVTPDELATHMQGGEFREPTM
ncbi:MAG: hypothetical protein WCB99_14465 [Candidatus Cybelea sp.]